jgi:hypothetical protein
VVLATAADRTLNAMPDDINSLLPDLTAPVAFWQS